MSTKCKREQEAAASTGRSIGLTEASGSTPAPGQSPGLEVAKELLQQPIQPLRIDQSSAETAQDALARAFTDARYTAARTSQVWGKVDGQQLDLQGLVSALDEQVSSVNAGSLAAQEGILVAQTKTLDAIFNNLARRAYLNLNEYPDAAERFLRLAFKAQSQGRANIETLAQMKNPPHLAIVKQANIANGPQQVNNGAQSSRAPEIESQQTKLLEAEHGERLDTGKTTPASGANQAMETGDAVHRASVAGR